MLCTAVGELNTLVVFFWDPVSRGVRGLVTVCSSSLGFAYCNWLSYSKALEAERVV